LGSGYNLLQSSFFIAGDLFLLSEDLSVWP